MNDFVGTLNYAPRRQMMTVADIKKHRGPSFVWVNIFGDDGEYVKTSKAALLRAIGADVHHRDGGLHDTTPVVAAYDDKGDLYIN